MPSSDGHIFVVDDDASFLSAVCRLIKTGGFRATGVAQLKELYKHLPLPQKSCVLADLVLDGESGLDIPTEFKKRGEIAPIIFMSATDDMGTLVAADAVGYTPCLRKPFEAKELFHCIEITLSQTCEASRDGTKHRKDE